MTAESRSDLHLIGGIDYAAGRTSPIWDQIEIINERDGGLVEAIVPLDIIRRDDVPVDEAHVAELAESIAREASSGSSEGQLSANLLAEVRGIDDELLIVDGFHRTAALLQLGSDAVYGTIRPDSTMEEVIDLRILTANTHQTVKFSRLVEWVEQAWARSPWSEQLVVTQGFALAHVKAMTGRNLGLAPEEVDEIRDWVNNKCDQWHVAVSSVYSHLTIAQIADPSLVKELRERSNGRKLDCLTSSHLGIIARGLPNRFELQQIAAAVAKSNALTAPRTRTVVDRLALAEDAAQGIAFVEELMKEGIQPTFAETKKRELAKAQETLERHADEIRESLAKSLYNAGLSIAALSIENAVLVGRYAAPAINETGERTVQRLRFPEPTARRYRLPRTERSATIERFTAFADGNRAKHASYLADKLSLNPTQTQYLLTIAQERITHDMEHGALGFVQLRSNHLFDQLVLRTARQIHGEGPGSEEAAKAAGRPFSNEVVVNADAILRALHSLDQPSTQALLLSLEFGLKPHAISHIMSIDVPKVVSLVRAAAAKFVQ